MGPGTAARNSIGMLLVTGMTVGTIFTLFVIRRAGILPIDRRTASTAEPTRDTG
jgi:hypothetical protein